MATGLDGFAERLKQADSNIGEFRAVPYHEPETDSFIYYMHDVPSFSRRINKYFTVFLADADKKLAGFEVKGISMILKAIEGLDDVTLVDGVPVKDGDGQMVDLSVIVQQALVPASPQLNPEDYAELDSIARSVRVAKDELCGA